MNANNSNINPHKTFPESASQHSPQIKEVIAVIFPFLADAPAEEHPFKLNDIVKTGNQYGIVTSLNKTEKPVTITWDASSGEDSFSWTYNLQYFGQFWNRDAPRAELKKSLESEPKIKKKGTF